MKNKLIFSMVFTLILCFPLVATTSAAEIRSIDTKPAEDINYTEATLIGNIRSGEVNISDIEVFFKHKETGTSWGDETEHLNVQENGDFNLTIDALENDTSHTFKAIASWNDTSKDGDEENFTTKAYPAIETGNSTDITHKSARLHANLTEIGIENEVTAYFALKEDGGTWNTTDNTKTIYEEGSFNDKITDLDSSTSYEYKAVVEWANKNVTEGTVNTFETEPQVYIETLEPEDITTSSAAIKGRLLGNGTKIQEKDTNISFWQSNPTELISDKGNVNEEGKFEEQWTDLDPATSYTYEAEVNWESYDAGGKVTFMTAPEFNISNLQTEPTEQYVDEEFDVSVDVENEGDVKYEYEAIFSVDDKERTEAVNISGGSTVSVGTNFSVGSSGTYDVDAQIFDESVETEIDIYQKPSVETLYPEEIGADYAILEGEVTNIGMEDEATVFFHYGDKDVDEEDWGSTSKKEVDSEEKFEQEVPIEEDVEYEYKAAVEWGNEESTGDIRSLEPNSCEYEDWENETCGGWECDEDEVYQTKETTDDCPDFCEDPRERCVESPDYCGEPNVETDLEYDIVNVTQGEWEVNTITVENTGTKDLESIELDIEAQVPEQWINITPDDFDIEQKEQNDFKVNFTPGSSAPVDKYSLDYTIGYDDEDKVKEGDLWISPDEDGEEEISKRYNKTVNRISNIEKDLERFSEETNVTEVNETLNTATKTLKEAKTAMENNNYVTAEKKVTEAEESYAELSDEVTKIEEELTVPWTWIGIGIIGILIAGILIYLFLPPAEGFESSGGYESPSKDSLKEKIVQGSKDLKEKIFGEEEEGYSYNG